MKSKLIKNKFNEEKILSKQVYNVKYGLYLKSGLYIDMVGYKNVYLQRCTYNLYSIYYSANKIPNRRSFKSTKMTRYSLLLLFRSIDHVY